jgi:HEAT repeat protein
MSDDRFLRETADDDELSLLFTAVGEDLTGAIADCIELAGRRSAVERRMIEMLESAVDDGLDDSSGAVWIALVLGEIQSHAAIPVLVRALAGRDETLAEAAIDAIKRIGEPAFDAVMQALEDADNPDFEHAACHALEGVSSWEHPYMLAEVRDFLLERIGRRSLSTRALEDAALAAARLGDVRALPLIKKALKGRFKGVNAALQDAVEMLQENKAGVPLVVDATPWQERVEWMTGDAFTPDEKE